MIDEILDAIGASSEGWSAYDDMGLDSLLEAPDGCVIEQDGKCSHGHESPLRAAGLI